MGKMKANVFVEKAVEIAKNFKTLYVMGCFGAPLTGSNVSRYCNNHSYNRAAHGHDQGGGKPKPARIWL